MIGENWSPLVKTEDLSSIHNSHMTDQLSKLSYALHMVEGRTDQLPKLPYVLHMYTMAHSHLPTKFF